ncbi:MAG TPA: acetoacetate--CoA ligase [Saprospiraceae bacterium]|nr:acetoacetate--CoA ligase [Saprospiraceae bacterium]HMQ83079.1 acetoacetate--CoA ligase [Saprospiraceae bacterium]
MIPTIWHPSEDFTANSSLRQFEQWLQQQHQLQFSDYESMWQWSTAQEGLFWEYIWQYFEVLHDGSYSKVMSEDPMPFTKWFEGTSLSYAEHLFRFKNEDRPALIFKAEGKAPEKISWSALEKQVKALQAFLHERGIGQGDCVAAYLPNIPQAIVAFIAVNAVGATWSCCSPDFGVNTVIDRFAQIEPKLLIAADGYRYNGKPFDRTEEVAQIAGQISSIQETILISYLKPTAENDALPYPSWANLIHSYSHDGSITFQRVPFNHPIWVLYSSGTTGKPKAITHSSGGVLLEHLKYMAFHNDVHEGENFFWFTTTGWMMWNFLQASLLVGATPVLYDGSPGYPTMNALWELAAELPIHHFGTSAPYIMACMKSHIQPGQTYDLSRLRSIGSTGAPLPEDGFKWVYENISEQVWLCSMSGGTDVCTAFVGGCPYKPVYVGHIQCRALGCALQAYDENGQATIDSLGEMVIEKPMPSMPIFFWNDTNHKRYKDSYFDVYPGKWRHGDWIQLYEDGSLVIHGRSDATLNRKGIRIGTAEIYGVLDKIPGIKDSLVLNLEKPNGDDIMPLFIMVKEDSTDLELIRQTINTTLKQECSPRHVPDFIEVVPDIPYTLSGKKMEVPVKKILLGMDIRQSLNRDAVRNPAALDFFMEMAADFRTTHLS